MNIGQLDGTRIIISLCEDDLEKMNISFEELDISGTHSRRILRELLRSASIKTGMELSGKRVFIEAMKHEHGCLLLITVLQKSPRKNYRIKTDSEPYIFDFCDIEDLICCIRALYRMKGRNYKSSVYFFGGKYCLVLFESFRIRKSHLDTISEYSCKKHRSGVYVSFLREHAVPAALDNAVGIMGAAFGA